MSLSARARASVVLLGVLAIPAAALVRPDIPRAELLARYAPPPSQFAEIEGMRVHYRDEGSGPPLVLVHGTSSSLHTWDRWAALLSSHRRVVRLDLPGFGLTGPAPDRDYRAERYARVVAALMDRLGVARADVAGNSLGGRVALTFTLAHPERVRKLVLVDAAGLRGQRPPAIFRLARTPRGEPALSPGGAAVAHPARTCVEVYGDPGRVDEAIVDRYQDSTAPRATGSRAPSIGWNRAVDPDLDERLGEVRAPTLAPVGGAGSLDPAALRAAIRGRDRRREARHLRRRRARADGGDPRGDRGRRRSLPASLDQP